MPAAVRASPVQSLVCPAAHVSCQMEVRERQRQRDQKGLWGQRQGCTGEGEMEGGHTGAFQEALNLWSEGLLCIAPPLRRLSCLRSLTTGAHPFDPAALLFSKALKPRTS
ncbi:hypothetical protein AOLI_G00285330 [Acnodon oligacanthus]